MLSKRDVSLKRSSAEGLTELCLPRKREYPSMRDEIGLQRARSAWSARAHGPLAPSELSLSGGALERHCPRLVQLT